MHTYDFLVTKLFMRFLKTNNLPIDNRIFYYLFSSRRIVIDELYKEYMIINFCRVIVSQRNEMLNKIKWLTIVKENYWDLLKNDVIVNAYGEKSMVFIKDTIYNIDSTIHGIVTEYQEKFTKIQKSNFYKQQYNNKKYYTIFFK